ncbi:hypothetical protein Tdes44962_MAKER07481 [Teratosphaeria destructans]|uniref:Extracellular membrane protein CFEM domain-containing protein n=1 Tax=Teratosphaeria destructans TaxID=418781 RepID=A0A9W7W687_9PEZI|nr:hypothetical protein Tdes44962_MAKER07481 [Teratosphaeria destructans]
MQFPLLLTIGVCLLARKAHSQAADSVCPDDHELFCQCLSINDEGVLKYEKAATRAACSDYPANQKFTFDDHIDLCWDKGGIKGHYRPFCGKVFAAECLKYGTFANCANKPDDKGIQH